MRRSELTRAAAAGAALLVLTGCAQGGEVPTGVTNTSSGLPAASSGVAATRTGVDDAFRARANTACKPFFDYNAANPFPFTGFDPEHPDAALLPQIGEFFDRNPANHSFVQALTDLGEPTAGQDEWHTVLDALRREQTLSQEQIAVARAKDATAFVANVKSTALQQFTVKQAFEKAGFVQTVDFCPTVY